MVKRCGDSHNPKFHCYGGRGITVCEEWKEDREAFIAWALANGYRRGLSIDRIDNDGPYLSENCRWATREEQHKANNLLVTVWGETKTLAQVKKRPSGTEAG
jgi:hypothetical protein